MVEQEAGRICLSTYVTITATESIPWNCFGSLESIVGMQFVGESLNNKFVYFQSFLPLS